MLPTKTGNALWLSNKKGKALWSVLNFLERLRTGSQPFFSADRLVNVPANLKGWTIRVPDSVRYQVCGRVEGATLKLEFLPRGMMLIVR